MSAAVLYVLSSFRMSKNGTQELPGTRLLPRSVLYTS
jgi:hypothetical protein